MENPRPSRFVREPDETSSARPRPRSTDRSRRLPPRVRLRTRFHLPPSAAPLSFPARHFKISTRFARTLRSEGDAASTTLFVVISASPPGRRPAGALVFVARLDRTARDSRAPGLSDNLGGEFTRKRDIRRSRRGRFPGLGNESWESKTKRASRSSTTATRKNHERTLRRTPRPAGASRDAPGSITRCR